MKLSEAMMLGSTVMKMEPRNWNSCALGCAGTAIGIPQVEGDMYNATSRAQPIQKAWPWLKGTCEKEWIAGGFIAIADIQAERIWLRFDNLVCNGEMTFEALVDYVRSIEPECGECNRFECTCAPKEAVPETKLVTAGQLRRN